LYLERQIAGLKNNGTVETILMQVKELIYATPFVLCFLYLINMHSTIAFIERRFEHISQGM
jgi:hypothetical protein